MAVAQKPGKEENIFQNSEGQWMIEDHQDPIGCKMPGHTILQREMALWRSLWGHDEVTKICGRFNCKSKIRAEIWKARSVLNHHEAPCIISQVLTTSRLFLSFELPLLFFFPLILIWLAHSTPCCTPSFGLLNTHVSSTSSTKNISQLLEIAGEVHTTELHG